MAQEETPLDTTASNWEKSWTLGLMGNQSVYHEWSYGGIDALSFTASSAFQLKYTHDKYINTSRIRLRFGQSRQSNGELQKTEDLIRVSNKIEYLLGNSHWSSFLETAFRTQFDEGFDPATGERISAFLSPGYFIENAGFTYKPTDYFLFDVGLGLKQTVVEIDGLDQYYGLGEDEDIRSEGGLTLAYEFNKELLPNLFFQSEFNTFTNLLLPVKSTDIFMYNMLTGKINNWFSAMIDLDMMYDDDFAEVLQLKYILSFGINVKIL